jgi:glycosyltransferase involved in cell wall biosynthesis
MKIGIDALPLRGPRTGIGNYIESLVQWIPEIAPQHEYFLYSNKPIKYAPLSPDKLVHERINSSLSFCPGALWLLGRGAALARTDQVDVFWASTSILPIGLPATVLKIITVYDMVWLRYPETTTGYNLFLQKTFARKGIAEADIVIVISQSTQEELIQTLGVAREKTRLIYPSIADRYKPENPQEAAKYISTKYGVPERYMATVGTVEPRKNLKVLIKTLKILKNNGQLACPLLVVGAKGWKNSHLFQEVKDSGLTNVEIRFVGYLPDEDMPFFYSGAQVFLFPSMYEGFGLPPVEAMACGVPVIASNAQCMPEVLGDAAILESLANADGFAAAIVRVQLDEALRHSMRARGIRRAQRFCSQDSAQRLVDVFENRCCRELHA